MKYNFDEVIERRGTDSVKYDAVSERWGRSDLLPMWVADMDFRTPPFVIEAIRRRLDHEVLGYLSLAKLGIHPLSIGRKNVTGGMLPGRC